MPYMLEDPYYFEDPDEFSYSKGVFCDCPECPVSFLVWIASKRPNSKGRLFASCNERHPGDIPCKFFRWKVSDSAYYFSSQSSQFSSHSSSHSSSHYMSSRSRPPPSSQAGLVCDADLQCRRKANTKCTQKRCRAHCDDRDCRVLDHRKAHSPPPAAQITTSTSTSTYIPTRMPTPPLTQQPSTHAAPSTSAHVPSTSRKTPVYSHVAVATRLSPDAVPEASKLVKSAVLVFAYTTTKPPIPREVQGSVKDGAFLVDRSVLTAVKLGAPGDIFCYWNVSLRGWVEASAPLGIRVEGGLKMNGSPVVLLCPTDMASSCDVDAVLDRLQQSSGSTAILSNPPILAVRRSTLQDRINHIEKITIRQARQTATSSKGSKRSRKETPQSPSSTPSPQRRSKKKKHSPKPLSRKEVIEVSSTSPSPGRSHHSVISLSSSSPSPKPVKRERKTPSTMHTVSVAVKKEPGDKPKRPHRSRSVSRSQSRHRSRSLSHSRSRSRHQASYSHSHHRSSSRSPSRRCSSSHSHSHRSQRHHSSPDRLPKPEPASPSPPKRTKSHLDIIEDPNHWPGSYYAVDIVAAIASKEKPRAAYFARKFPGVEYKASTFADQRSRWKSAPASTCARYLGYKKTKLGLWRNFMRDVPMPNAELNAEKKYISRLAKKEKLGGSEARGSQRRHKRYETQSLSADEEASNSGDYELEVKVEESDDRVEVKEEYKESDDSEEEEAPPNARPSKRPSKFVHCETESEGEGEEVIDIKGKGKASLQDLMDDNEEDQLYSDTP
ncbi:hypothetical protein D9758_018941 [Tetrapyrgos nigripes]|uniref:Zinc finger GRF-type domain-containing protein n=1 Tax=Tetrapyrgos nigripes TaxID=182062 RepID=A0A8H5AUR8_9AGAR|nr:hypothetical protein D9758_018941 [Tetrapyrgos nigripes]